MTRKRQESFVSMTIQLLLQVPDVTVVCNVFFFFNRATLRDTINNMLCQNKCVADANK